MKLPKHIISADSHVAETENAYQDIDPRYRDRMPRNVEIPGLGAAVKIDGMPIPVPMTFICNSDRPAETRGTSMSWAQVDPAGFDASFRLARQDRDGVHAEVIFPSVGMALCNHPDADYKKACFDAYNRWLAEYCSIDPQRLTGAFVIVARTIDEGIEELRQARAMGFRTVMLQGDPIVEDYDHPCYDSFWEACVDLGLAVNFHILTNRQDMDTSGQRRSRGPKICDHQRLIRGNQDIISMFVFGGVFERHPQLKMVTVEADASWLPHYAHRMDKAYDFHRFWQNANLSRRPSEYLYDNIYLCFQDDYPIGDMPNLLPMQRLMWSNDYPHGDGTYPNSAAVIEKLTAKLSAQDTQRILHDNAAAVYGIQL